MASQPHESNTSSSRTINNSHYSALINDDVNALIDGTNGLDLTQLVEYDNRTMLHLAASMSQLNTIDWIINQSPQLLRQPNCKHDIPIHVAAKACQFQAVQRLVFWANTLHDFTILEMVNEEYNTALHIALENQQQEMAQFLFQHYPKSFYFLNQQGVSPLYLAIKAEFWELVSAMLSELQFQRYVDAQENFFRGKSVVHAAIAAKRKVTTVVSEQPPIMPPAQGSRLDEMEAVVASLQGDIPELRESMEDKFKELRKCFEDSQAKAIAEQNKKMEESAKEQRKQELLGKKKKGS